MIVDLFKILLALIMLVCSVGVLLHGDRIIIIDNARYEAIRKQGYRVSYYIDKLIDEDIERSEKER